MNTMQLECFIAVAETLNFARAADRLNVTQPAITQQIHSLEKELDVKLFKRTTRTVEITPSGTAFMNDAKSILKISDRAKRRFAEHEKDDWDFFSIGCHAPNELYMFSPVLKELAQKYPNIYPVFQIVPFQHLYQLLNEEDVDVIVSFHEKRPRKSQGIYKEMTKIPITAVLPKENPLSHKSNLSISDLKSERLILIDPQKCPDSLGKIQYLLMEDRFASDLYFCDSVDAAATLAQAGYGVAVLPDLLTTKTPILDCVPLVNFAPLSYGIYYKSINGKPILKTFLQFAKECFKDN